MLIMKNGKKQIMEGIELLNQEISIKLGEKKLKVLENIGSRHYQTSRDERKK